MTPNKIKDLYRIFAFSAAFVFFVPAFTGCASKEEKAKNHLQKAEEYISGKEWDKAVIELKNTLQLEPKSDEAYFKLGKVFLQQKKGREAFQAFNTVISINPDHVDAHLRLSQIYLLGKQIDKAREEIQLVLDQEPESVEALKVLSGIQVLERNLEGAIGSLEKAVKISPEEASVQLSLARLYLIARKIDQAKEAYSKAIDLDPRVTAAYVELSQLLKAEGKAEQAEELLIKMVEQSDAKHIDMAVLAAFYESEGKWDLAEKTYLKAVDLSPKEDISPYIRLSNYYKKRGDYEKSISQVEAALKVKDDLNLRVYLGDLYYDFRQIDKAETIVDEVLAKDKGVPTANFLKGKILIVKREFEEAIERLDYVLRENPNAYMAYYYKGLALTSSGQNELGENNLVKALEGNPQNLKARLLLAEAYLRRRNVELAREQVEATLKLDPKGIQPIMLKGALKVLEKDLKGAEETYLKAIELAPKFAPAHVKLGLVYRYMHRRDDSRSQFDKALKINPLQVDALTMLVADYMSDQQFDQAIEIAERHREHVRENNAMVAFLNYLEARVYLVKGEPVEAEEKLKAALELNPAMVEVYRALASLYASLGRVGEARSQYESLLEQDPNSLSAYMALGIIAEQEGMNDEAEAHYRKLLSIKNDFAPAANNLAWRIMDSGGNIDEALKFAQIAKKNMQNSPTVMDTLGWAYYQKGRYPLAASEFSDAVELAPDHPVIHYHLGMALHKNKQNDQAKIHLKKALELDSGFEGAEEARSVLMDLG